MALSYQDGIKLQQFVEELGDRFYVLASSISDANFIAVWLHDYVRIEIPRDGAMELIELLADDDDMSHLFEQISAALEVIPV
jgi:hypothetical protein